MSIILCKESPHNLINVFVLFQSFCNHEIMFNLLILPVQERQQENHKNTSVYWLLTGI